MHNLTERGFKIRSSKGLAGDQERRGQGSLDQPAAHKERCGEALGKSSGAQRGHLGCPHLSARRVKRHEEPEMEWTPWSWCHVHTA